jgi:hypothetical protein
MDQTAFEQALREETPSVLKALRRVFPEATLGAQELAAAARVGSWSEVAPEEFFTWLYAVAARLHVAPDARHVWRWRTCCNRRG